MTSNAHTAGDERSNCLLRALHDGAQEAWQSQSETVPLRPREVLIEAGERLSHIYFPHTGVVSLVASLKDGLAETATIGIEGFVGIEALLGGEISAARALVQLAGTATRIPVDRFRFLLEAAPEVREVLQRYARFFLVQTLQSVACNGLHAVEERCARWLLMAHDRAGEREGFHLTQEFLAEMLGVHRPSVTIVARTLQNAGLIRYSRGLIVIADRRGLEEVACECYGIVRRALLELMPDCEPARRGQLSEGVKKRAPLSPG